MDSVSTVSDAFFNMHLLHFPMHFRPALSIEGSERSVVEPFLDAF